MAKPYAVERVPRATKTTTQRLKVLTICLPPMPNILASLSLRSYRDPKSRPPKTLQYEESVSEVMVVPLALGCKDSDYPFESEENRIGSLRRPRRELT